MKSEEADKFDIVLSRLFRTMGKPVPDPDVKRVWWDVFAKFDLEEFATACAEYVRSETRPPVPAAVRQYIPRRVEAQRLLSHQTSPRHAAARLRAADLLRECRRRLERKSLPDKSKADVESCIIDGRAAVLVLGRKSGRKGGPA